MFLLKKLLLLLLDEVKDHFVCFLVDWNFIEDFKEMQTLVIVHLIVQLLGSLLNHLSLADAGVQRRAGFASDSAQIRVVRNTLAELALVLVASMQN